MIKEFDYLSKSDHILATHINSYIQSNKLETKNNDITNFEALSRIIIGQQLSKKATDTIWRRSTKLIKHWKPNFVLKHQEDLKNSGISKNKLRFITELAVKFEHKNFCINKNSNDSELRNKLLTIKGIGNWSCDMFLIFQLNKPDIFSFEDAGLRRSVRKIYKLSMLEYEEKICFISEKWKPYRSFASKVLWHSIDSDS